MTLPASALLENIAGTMRADASRDALTFGEFVEMLGEKSLILGVLIFTLPNLFSIPGVSSVLALFMAFFLIQLMIGRKSIWLPEGLRHRKIPEKPLLIAIDKSAPLLKCLERVSKPQLSLFASHSFVVIACLISLVLTGIVFLPLSFIGNVLPSICIIIMMVGLLERDGRLILIGQLAGLAVIGGLFMIVIKAMIYLLGKVGIVISI